MTIEADIALPTEEFGISPRKAAALITRDTEAVEVLSGMELRRQNQRDSLAKLPSPDPKFRLFSRTQRTIAHRAV